MSYCQLLPRYCLLAISQHGYTLPCFMAWSIEWPNDPAFIGSVCRVEVPGYAGPIIRIDKADGSSRDFYALPETGAIQWSELGAFAGEVCSVTPYNQLDMKKPTTASAPLFDPVHPKAAEALEAMTLEERDTARAVMMKTPAAVFVKVGDLVLVTDSPITVETEWDRLVYKGPYRIGRVTKVDGKGYSSEYRPLLSSKLEPLGEEHTRYVYNGDLMDWEGLTAALSKLHPLKRRWDSLLDLREFLRPFARETGTA